MSSSDRNDPRSPPRLADGDHALGRLLARVGDPEPARDDEKRVWEALVRSRRVSSRKWLYVPVIAIPALAAVVIAILVRSPDVRQDGSLAVQPPPPPAPAPFGIISDATGTVYIEAPQRPIVVGRAGEPVVPGSRVRTETTSAARIRFAADAEVELEAQTSAVLSQQPEIHIELAAGKATVSVAGMTRDTALTVGARDVHLVILESRFTVAADQHVEVAVVTGAVELSSPDARLELRAGDCWSALTGVTPCADEPALAAKRERVAAPVPPAPAPAPAPPAPAPESAYDRAMRLVGERVYDQAAAALADAANGGGLQAELALYELGRIQYRYLGDLAGARATLESYRQKYPRGALRHEADLTLVELLLGEHAYDRAGDEITAFLAANPESERATELHLLRGNARREAGDCVAALVDFDHVIAGAAGTAVDDALYFAAVCAAKLGRTTQARDYLARSVAQFPNGRHTSEAKQALSALQEK